MRDFSGRSDRRGFLKTAAATVAATTVPSWFLEESRAAWLQSSDVGEPRSIALIGCGGRGRGVAREASAFGRITAVCDVDARHIAEAQKLFPDAKAYRDFREVMDQNDIDVIVCGTVDHWHTLISIAAMRAGKDVYCEKPLTLTIDEGKRLVKVANETNRILQTGSQQRSDARFRLACELVRNGRIGKVQQVDAFLPKGRRDGPFSPAAVPGEFDWEFWKGPTPDVEFIPEKAHVTFRYWYDYSGGTMTDWGAHHNDIALWGLGLEKSGPVTISGRPLVDMIPGGYTAASEYAVEYTYDIGVRHRCISTAANEWNGAVSDRFGQHHGVRFIGSDGWIWVTRGSIEASDPEMLTEPLPSDAERLYVSDNHMQNFMSSVESREQPICNAEIGHRSVSICHLGVIAIRTGEELHWDPKAERFTGNEEMNKWLSREMRAPWTYDSV